MGLSDLANDWESTHDPMTGDYIGPPQSLGVPANNAADQSAMATASNNALARSMGFPQYTPPAQAAPAPAAPAAAAPQGPIQGIAYPGSATADAAAAAAPQLGIVPGSATKTGFRPESRTTKTTSKSSPYSEAADEAAVGGLKPQNELEAAEMGAAGQQAAVDRQGQQYMAANDAADAAGMAARRKDQIAQVHDYHQKIQNLMTEASNYKEDPMKWFHDQSTAGQIGTAISMAIAGFGYGYSGRGVNPADLINKMIEHSVGAQRAGHQAKLGEIDTARAQLQDLRQQFGDEDSAQTALIAAKRQYVISRLQQAASDQMAPANQRLAAAKLAADQQQRLSDTLGKLDDKRLTSIEQSGSEKYQQGGGAGDIGVEVTINGQKHVIPMAKALEAQKLGILPATSLEARQAEANLKKTTAETTAIETKNASTNAPYTNLVSAAQRLKSTAYDPTRAFQASDAAEHARALSDYNIQAYGLWHEMHPGMNRMPDEVLKRFREAYVVDPGDLQSTIDDKVKNFIQSLKGEQAGAAGAGAGAKEE